MGVVSYFYPLQLLHSYSPTTTTLITVPDAPHPSLTTTTLLTLPEDALALLLANLFLPSDGGALRATAAFFAHGGAGDAALARACQLVASRTLDCLPADVLRVMGAAAQDEDDWLRTAALVLRMHRHGKRAAGSNHTLVVAAAGRVAACGANEAGQLGNGSVSQFSSTICSQVPTYSVQQYQARQLPETMHMLSPC